MKIIHTRAELQATLLATRNAGERISFVPTMGYLHEGHLSLVDAARRHADAVVMSIYVNPMQFGPGEDLARYPRDLDRDADLARARGVRYLFAPDDQEMYASPAAVTVHAPQLSNRLCGLFRPGHFEGVLTVVAKLFNIVRPDVAVFGQKDLQQCVLVRRMSRDLSYDIELVIAPIVREADGLALSSRNVYLSPTEREVALTLSRALRAAQQRYRAGENDPAALVHVAREVLDHTEGVRLQYVELVDADNLETPATARDSSVLATAALVGKTRLIDNVILGSE